MTESGWLRSGVTVTPEAGGDERVMGGGVGEGEGVEVVGDGVMVVVGVSPHMMGDGGGPEHSIISLMNSQSVPPLNANVIRSILMSCSTLCILLNSVFSLEEKVQVSELVIISGPLALSRPIVAGGPILAEGTVKV